MHLGLKKIGVIVILIVIERKKFGYFSITFELDLNYFWIILKNKKIIFFNIFYIKIIVKIEKNIESYKNLQFKKLFWSWKIILWLFFELHKVIFGG